MVAKAEEGRERNEKKLKISKEHGIKENMNFKKVNLSRKNMHINLYKLFQKKSQGNISQLIWPA